MFVNPANESVNENKQKQNIRQPKNLKKKQED